VYATDNELLSTASLEYVSSRYYITAVSNS